MTDWKRKLASNNDLPATIRNAPSTMIAVIKPWLVAGLVVALADNVLLSAVLIVKLSRFGQIQKEADDLRQAREKLNTDLAALRQQIQTQEALLVTN